MSKPTRGYCDIIMHLRKLVTVKYGVKPGFHEGHVIRALETLLEERVIGRKRLSRILSIGETSARNLIKRLEEHGIVDIDRVAGAVLTRLGEEYARVIKDLIKVIEVEGDPMGFGWRDTVLIIINDLPPPNTPVTVIRDKTISVNARASLIAYRVGGRIVVPGVMEPELYDRIVEFMRPYADEYCTGDCTLVYSSIASDEPLMLAGLKLGYELLRHFCIRREYC